MTSRFAGGLLLAAAALQTGCAYSLVEGGRVREKSFEAVVARTAAARGIEPRRHVEAQVITPNEIAAVLKRAIARGWSDDQIRRLERGYAALGVWPADRDLLAEYLDVMSEEVGGLYDPADRTLYIVDHGRADARTRFFSALLRRDLALEMVLTHELVHALQHEAYPFLLGNESFFHGQDDAATAVQAAIEGDATRYGMEALDLGIALPSPDDLRAGIDADIAASGEGALAGAPALIRLTLGFPYTHGYRLAYAEGAALLESPPVSSEQVLHAEQRHATLLAVDLRAVRTELPRGCSVVHEDTLGELGISILFRNLASDVPEDAWVGWDGDRYLVAECGGQVQLLWLTFWDSQTDALEFATAYAGLGEALVARAGHTTPPHIARSEREVLIYSDSLAGVAARLPKTTQHRRIGTLAELREYFGGDSP